MSQQSSTERPLLRRTWYEDGLRFACRPGCAACCSDHGEYTALYLTAGDVRRLAAHLALETAEFKRRYTVIEDDFLLLRMDQPDCPFLNVGLCQVYDARPVQCRTFPFWKENLKSRRTWIMLCEFCPGIDVGRLHDGEAITRELDRRKRGS
jgi:Fe-S-cluster containining protein